MKQILMVVLLLTLTGCTNLQKISPDTPISPQYLSNSFDSLAEFDPELWHFEVKSEDRVSFSTTQYKEGMGSLKLTVVDGDYVNLGERAELVLKNSDPLHQLVWYRWSFLIPEDYVDVEDQTKGQVIAQWHDQPEGGDWSVYPGHAPLVGLWYGKDQEQGPGVQFYYGRSAEGYEGYQPSEPFFITKGKWYTVTVNVYWSLGKDGFAQFWIWDGTTNHPILSMAGEKVFRGSNMFNTAPAYLKLGFYRDPAIRSTNSIYLDHLERASSQEELTDLY